MSAPIDDARLAEMQARCDAATPGPWQRSRYVFHPSNRRLGFEAQQHADEYERTRVIRGPGRVGEPNCNALFVFEQPVGNEQLDFIAAARTDVPDLIAEVKRLRDGIAALHRPVNGPMGSDVCEDCLEYWPCATAALIA